MITIITTKRLRALKNSLAMATRHINTQEKMLLEREAMIYRLREQLKLSAHQEVVATQVSEAGNKE